MKTPTVSFKTIGCRLNKAETAKISAQFENAGFQIVPFGSPSDICVIHGCAVTRNAEHDTLHYARTAHHSAGRVVITGCPVELAGEEFLKSARDDLLVPQHSKFSIPALLHSTQPERFPAPASDTDTAGILPRFTTARAWVKVQDGCDFRCAYCVVPETRGAPASRPAVEIVDEVRRLADAGYKEIVLTGANVGCYSDGGHGLVELLTRLEVIQGIDRIRLSSVELTTAERPVIDRMADSSKLCRFLHAPLQSGDDGILAAMGRRYTSGEYRGFVEYAVSKLGPVGLGTDIIVGFPDEDFAAFNSTVELVEALPFSNLHVFPYSQRPRTRAAAMADTVSAEEKKARVQYLLDVEARKRKAFAEQFIGKRVSVLVERVGPDGRGTGWIGEYLEASVGGAGLARNRIVTFTPSRVDGAVLLGEV